jgi:hypothetical protein
VFSAAYSTKRHKSHGTALSSAVQATYLLADLLTLAHDVDAMRRSATPNHMQSRSRPSFGGGVVVTRGVSILLHSRTLQDRWDMHSTWTQLVIKP